MKLFFSQSQTQADDEKLTLLKYKNNNGHVLCSIIFVYNPFGCRLLTRNNSSMAPTAMTAVSHAADKKASTIRGPADLGGEASNLIRRLQFVVSACDTKLTNHETA